MRKEKIIAIIESALKKKHIHGIVLGLEVPSKNVELYHAAGNFSTDSKYYIASINKLIVSAIILRYIAQGKLFFNDLLVHYLPKEYKEGLHIFKNSDYTPTITIQHLLSQTSGLPCYLSDKPAYGISGMKELEGGIDRPWPIDEVIERVRQLQPHFIPGEANKAKYIDTNHQLLGFVIESIEQKPMAEVLSNVFRELNMKDSYVFTELNDTNFIFPYMKDEQADIRKFLASTQNDIISTAKDQMIFIRAFYDGHFYPKEKLKELEVWNNIFFPFRYGIGIQQFYTPRFLSPFKKVPPMVGHCGSTGTFMFYIRELDLFVTGTTNQQANPQAAFQTIMRIVYSMI